MVEEKKLIVSTMKDEGPYLLEWIAYHRAIGFTDFLIYTNDCSDGTDLLLDRLHSNNVVTHVRNEVLKRGPHKSALKYAKAHESYKSAKWVYVCDVDEFLNIKVGSGHVDDLIAYYPDADAIPVTWRLFSHDGHRNLYPGNCTQAFTDAEPASHETDSKGRFVKTLFKPNSKVKRLGLHAPVYEDGSEGSIVWGAIGQQKDPASDPRRPDVHFGYEIAQVNHYAVRSIDAFLIKRNRGRANHVKETIGMDYWTRWCRGGEEDKTIFRHLDAMNKEYLKLTQDPVVAHLQDGAKAYQAQQLQELLKREDFKALRAELVGASPAAQYKIAVTPETEALRVKAPKRHKNRIRMLERMPKNGRCAEIGVWNGGFSGVILEVTQPRELTLIDPWELLSGQDEGEWTHKKHQNHEFMQGMYTNVARNYAHLPNVKISKGFSAEVLETFPDNYFDWLYIDGNHLYEFVRKDVEIAFRKVRTGGIIAGDDFYWKKNERQHVKEAVLDAMKAHGMQSPPDRIGQQFMITVPEL